MALLLQAVHAIGDSFDKLKKAYNQNRYIELEKAKKDILELQEKIGRMLR